MKTVRAAQNDLAAPSMVNVADGKLDPAQVPSNGAPVVMTVGAEHAGRTLTLVLALAEGTELFTQDLPIGSSGRPITLRIPKQHFTDNLGAQVKVFYRISTVGDSSELAFQIDQGFAGAYEFDLTAQRFTPVYLDGELKLPGELPAFLRFTRAAPGATSYACDDESVATVDDQGQVTALRNGQATITAQSPGGPQSYVLTVKGIRGLEFLARQGSTWQSADTLCKSVGMQLPTQADFITLQGLYGAQMAGLGLPNYPIWGASLGGGTAWTYDPYTQVLTSESTDVNILRQVAGIG
ncbi:Ig-like domain-containing protein [Pseudomonas sp. MH2]|uniref:Ig-like domain-containing protein n=1 Tax=Pseudomonas machongensis TaxID=3110229 RepID=A0ABU5VJM7_9PSED|nr:Ig-like domain-containing protein [Pseudomonas sp. MH2]MEA5673584.1 Ig-like domain-containing protein [Pseudomonas sp. MH2]